MYCVFEVLILLFFSYFLIGGIFCGMVIYTAPTEFKKQVKTKKIIEVLTFLWPCFVVSFFKDVIKNKKEGNTDE
jgi:hypothetical protein